VTTARGHEVLFAGPGAGPDATAATIVDDIVEVVSTGAALPPVVTRPTVNLAQPPRGRWLVVGDRTEAAAAIVRAQFGRLGTAIERTACAADRRAALTGVTSWPAIQTALAACQVLGVDVRAFPAFGR
jgi:hypothetical protein